MWCIWLCPMYYARAPNQGAMVSTRTMIQSPFASKPWAIYAGGFDANHIENENHNTALLCRGEMAHAEIQKHFLSSFGKPESLVKLLEAESGKSIRPSSTLLFIDEVQECPEAILALRYFKEKCPTCTSSRWVLW